MRGKCQPDCHHLRVTPAFLNKAALKKKPVLSSSPSLDGVHGERSGWAGTDLEGGVQARCWSAVLISCANLCRCRPLTCLNDICIYARRLLLSVREKQVKTPTWGEGGGCLHSFFCPVTTYHTWKKAVRDCTHTPLPLNYLCNILMKESPAVQK